MKKTILLCLALMACLTCIGQDFCNTTYVEALQEFNKGHYVEAQRKLVIVAQTCGDYADVWSKLKACNKKLAELAAADKERVASLKKETHRADQRLKQQSDTIRHYIDTIHVVQHQVDSLTRALNDAQEQLVATQNRLDSLEQKHEAPAPMPLPADSLTTDTVPGVTHPAKQAVTPPAKSVASPKKHVNTLTFGNPKK